MFVFFQPESCLRETILPSTLAWLQDPTWAVRDCACRSLARLLSVCPAAANDAIMGTGGDIKAEGDKDTHSAAPTMSSTSPDGASGDSGGTITIATLTANAVAGGLRGLASDKNYHLRQIFILTVQVMSAHSSIKAIYTHLCLNENFDD